MTKTSDDVRSNERARDGQAQTLANKIDRLDALIEQKRYPPRDDTDAAKAARASEYRKLYRELQDLVPEGEVDEVVAGVRLVAPVGAGEFGCVWRGMIDGRERAVKIHRHERLGVEGSLHAFRKGVRAIRILTEGTGRPESIPPLLSAHEGSIAYSMPYYSGGNLSNVHAAGWRTEKKLEIFREVCRAVHYAHGRGVLHRDIRPQNIVLDELAQPRLIDFDIAEILGPENTRTTIVRGNAKWASPEQLQQHESQKAPTTDVYSLGVLLLYLILEREWNDLAEDRKQAQKISSVSARAIEKCMERRPENRPQNVSEVLRLLDAGVEAGVPQRRKEAPAFEAAARARAREIWAEAVEAARKGDYATAFTRGNEAQERLPLGSRMIQRWWQIRTDFWQLLAEDLSPKQAVARWVYQRRTPLRVIIVLGVFFTTLAVWGAFKYYEGWAQRKGAMKASLPDVDLAHEIKPPETGNTSEEKTSDIVTSSPPTQEPSSHTESPQDVPPGERIALLDRELLGKRTVFGEDYSGTVRHTWKPATAKPRLDGVILNGADLAQANLTDASLKHAKLRSANFRFAKFMGADLTRADLRPLKEDEMAEFGLSTIPESNNFYRADFGPSKNQSATLIDADLRGSRLLGANFADADLTNARFDGASVSYADFQGSTLTLDQLCSMSGWEVARLPGDVWKNNERVKAGDLRISAKTECSK